MIRILVMLTLYFVQLYTERVVFIGIPPRLVIVLGMLIVNFGECGSENQYGAGCCD